jgi:hypothetical protein
MFWSMYACMCVCVRMRAYAYMYQAIEVKVAFCPTDDPFFYDVADRILPKSSIEDETLYEDEVEGGRTNLSYKDWLLSRPVDDDRVDVALLPPWEELCEAGAFAGGRS